MSSQIFSLRWRLLLAYLIAMAAILGTFATAVYILYTRSLNQQWNEELMALAKATGLSLGNVKTKDSKSLEKNWHKNYPLHHLIEPEQGLEWFNAEGQLLAKAGKVFPNYPVTKDFSQVNWQRDFQVKPPQIDRPSARIEVYHPHLKTVYGPGSRSIVQQQGRIRNVTVPVYASEPHRKTLRLEGYIRASESTMQVEAALNHFRVGLGMGGITALFLSSISALCLTKLVVKPSEQSSRRLKHFSADASHQLRNPLTALNTTVELMQSHPEQLNPSDAKKLAIIVSASEQIGRLVEDMLFIVRSDPTTGFSHIEEPPIPLDEVLEDLVERFEPQAQSKGINLESRLPSGISVKGNTNLLIRLFSNLLENALKYAEEGGRVILSLNKRRRFAIVRLDETGQGMPSEYSRFVFESFWRVDKGGTQQREGGGVELAIAEAIVERHQGKIKVGSKKGVGSCFQVHLPLFL